ncbi:Pnap_2097 family protein [Cupriavidus necator]
MEAVVSRHVAGMPQLAYTGLSENWLLKTCGDLHWRLLAAGVGLVVPDFRDAGGHPVYAAFTAIRVRDAAPQTIGEHAEFSIGSRIVPAGGVKHLSEHTVDMQGDRRASVTMLSTFIRRTRERDNRSVVRTMPTVAAQWAGAGPSAQAGELSLLARRFRCADWGTHLGLDQARHRVCHAAEYLPCPCNDFNGADLLYFASFQAMVDRAEWQWRRDADPPTVFARDLFFHGNVNVGESLELTFSALREDEEGMTHWCEIRRSRDGEKIADVVTQKRWRQR